MELSTSQNLLFIIVLICDRSWGRVGGAFEVLEICSAKLAKEDLH